MRRAIVLWWQRLVDQGPAHFAESWALAGLTFLSNATRVMAWVRSRRRSAQVRLSSLVLCVGNISVGGTGKTPVVRALALEMKARGFRVAVACKAYRARARKAVQVPPQSADPAQYGDEPSLLASWLRDIPVYVAKERVEAALLAEAEGAQVVILDDGFQARSRLYRDLDFVVIPSKKPFGNRRLLPAGPLREMPEALREAPAVILMGSGDAAADKDGETQVRRVHPSAMIIPASLEVHGLWDIRAAAPFKKRHLEGRTVLAFCAIGNPGRFSRTLYHMGAAAVHLIAFDDHHPYSAEDLDRLVEAAGAKGCEILATTEKDAIKLPGLLRAGGAGSLGNLKSHLHIAVVRTAVVLDREALDAVLKPMEALCPEN